MALSDQNELRPKTPEHGGIPDREQELIDISQDLEEGAHKDPLEALKKIKNRLAKN